VARFHHGWFGERQGAMNLSGQWQKFLEIGCRSLSSSSIQTDPAEYIFQWKGTVLSDHD
jgi:hypothetical protein